MPNTRPDLDQAVLDYLDRDSATFGLLRYMLEQRADDELHLLLTDVAAPAVLPFLRAALAELALAGILVLSADRVVFEKEIVERRSTETWSY